MRVSALFLGLCLFVIAVPLQAQSQVGGITLTPEQQRIFDALPPAQRGEILRQIRDARGAPVTRTGESGTADPAAGPIALDAQRTLQDSSDDDAEPPTVIRPDDTLVIEIAHPPLPEDATPEQRLVPRRHLLQGRHVVQLDRFGRLSMPGLRNVPLAGLRAEQAELRLMAEPALQDMEVLVTRLTLKPQGREALEPFGYEIFQRGQSRLSLLGWPDSGASLPVPADYTVGPGDIVQLFLFGKETGRHDVEITSDGTLQVPELGPVSVAGMRFSAMKDLVERRVREETIGMQATVSMGELRSVEVFVIGEVNRPGLHQVSALSTAINALYAAQGITKIGSMRDIRVIRGGENVSRLDLYDLLLDGNPRGDVRLESGDVLFVPSTGPRVGVIGEAHRPAWYETADGMTLAQLLDNAGGPTPAADLRHVQVERPGADGRIEFINIDGTDRQGLGTRLRGGDLVTIPKITDIAENAILLHGYFASPGARAWRQGLQLSDVISGRHALGADPDLDYGVIVRPAASGRGVAVRTFSPRAVLAGEEDFPLEPRDELYTFGYDEPVARRALLNPLIDRLRRQATRDGEATIAQVTGAVRAPGYYPVSSDMRLSDLLRAAGGLGESAYRETAEITRFDVRGGEQREVEHVEVNLAAVLRGDPAGDLMVEPHDVLNIKEIPAWSERGAVELRGEVRFPGTYPIRPGETLAQIVERAGGLSEYAYPQAAVFTRETLREREQRQIDNMVRRLEADVAAAAAQGGAAGAQAQAIAGSLVEQLRETRAVGRLVIDLPRLLAARDDESGVLVHDGDTLVIPPRPQEVSVLGEVHFPTSHIFEPGLRGTEYLERSGGVTARADTRRIYVVRANGSVETPGRRGRIQVQPGDTIVVPLDADRLPAMVRVMNISQVLYQLGIAAAAWNTLGVF